MEIKENQTTLKDLKTEGDNKEKESNRNNNEYNYEKNIEKKTKKQNNENQKEVNENNYQNDQYKNNKKNNQDNKNSDDKNNKTSKSSERSAEFLATKQREISIAEFFEKNRHLLGFDSKRKALLTAVKEAVDNSLDACEEARILPDIKVSIIQIDNERYRIIVEDNGPGIVKNQIPKIFAKLLYGSKFHSLKQSRGQQGIGISAAALYGQLTTGKPIKITSKIKSSEKAYYYQLYLDTLKNEPKIVEEKLIDTNKEHGTKIEIELESNYYQGSQSVDEYIKQVAIANPHANITYVNPKAEYKTYIRATNKLPIEPKEIKPHPYGIEVGTLLKMLANTKYKNMTSFLKNEFSRVSKNIAIEILNKALISPDENPKKLNLNDAQKIIKAIKKTKIMSPNINCLSPIQQDQIELGLRKEVNAEFYCAITRPPSVYRGNPFIIEVGFAYGGLLNKDDVVKVLRFANKVPLLYQAGACALTKSVIATNWKRYGLNQPKGSLPIGPLIILIHIASVWVPYTNEAKEAIANYEEIIKEVKLAFQELGRKLYKYIRKKTIVKEELHKRDYITKFIPHISLAFQQLLNFDEDEKKEIENNLKTILEKKRGKIDKMEFDASSNKYYDEEMKLNVKGGIVEDYLTEENETDKKKTSQDNKKSVKINENSD